MKLTRHMSDSIKKLIVLQNYALSYTLLKTYQISARTPSTEILSFLILLVFAGDSPFSSETPESNDRKSLLLKLAKNGYRTSIKDRKYATNK